MQRTKLQNAKFAAMVGDVANVRYLGPWKRAFAREAFKRYFLQLYVHEARMEAFGTGNPDPFPARTARSSELETWQMNELIECVYAHAAMNLNLVLD